MTAAPLAGVRVLDLTTVVVGPACTQRLADYGAEIIKVEAPSGDVLRRLGGRSPTGEHGGGYLHLNRNKRAVCLDLKQASARDALRRVAATCDVFVSNIRPEALQRLGLSAADLRATRPALIHCTITGFGAGGPYRGMPAYDSVIQGVAGVAALSAARDGVPRYVPLLLCDHVVGEIAAGAILAALFERERSGNGVSLEVPMLETMAHFVLAEHLAGASFDQPVGPPGDVRLLDPNNGPLQTEDGWISLTANTDAQVRAFFGAVGRPDLADDPRFDTVASRIRHAPDWFAARGAALRERPTAEWLPIFAACDVPAMPCHSLDSLLTDPHLLATDLLGRAEHPTEGTVRTLRPTVVHDGITAPPGPPAAPLGADTVRVLAGAGLSDDEIAALLQTAAAHQPRARDATRPAQETPR